MAASWAYSTATTGIDTGGCLVSQLTHIFTITLESKTDFIFSDYSTHWFFIEPGHLPCTELVFANKLSTSYYQTFPFYYSCSNSIPTYGIGGVITPPNYSYLSNFSVISTSDAYNMLGAETETVVVNIYGELPISVGKSGSFVSDTKWAIAIPPAFQSYFSKIFKVPPTHILAIASGIGPDPLEAKLVFNNGVFVRYGENIPDECRYLTSTFDARVHKNSTNDPYVACHHNGDFSISQYPVTYGDFVKNKDAGYTVHVASYDYRSYLDSPAAISYALSVFDKHGNVLSSQSGSISYSLAASDDTSTVSVYTAYDTIDVTLSAGAAFVGFTSLSYDGSIVLTSLSHPGYSPFPCQGVDGEWLPGVLYKS